MIKKNAVILACMLVCLTLFTGCTDQKGSDGQDTDFGSSVEIGDVDLEIDTERKPGIEDNFDSVSLPDGYTYSFRAPENSDGIVGTNRE